MEIRPFYMIAQDCFERKEFLGSISEIELKTLVSLFLESEDFNLGKVQDDLERGLKLGEQYLKRIDIDPELLQKYQNLTSYSKGAEVLLLLYNLEKMKRHTISLDSLMEDDCYIELKRQYEEILAASYQEYKRVFETPLAVM